MGPRIDEAIAAVLAHGRFILGPEVEALEAELARRGGVAHAVGCSSGTDGLVLALLGLGVEPDDAVLVPAFTFAATAEAVVRAGAVPLFVDVTDDTCCVDAAGVAAAATWARRQGLRPRGVIAVDLYGHPADYGLLRRMAAAEGLFLLADAAQSFGARLEDAPVGSLADVTVTSFFPSKPLGCYGDGGAVMTDDAEVACGVRSLRAHGADGDKSDPVRVGMNARLDTVQAAVLLAKLELFDDELAARRAAAAQYGEALAGAVRAPSVLRGARPAWACYTVRTPQRNRVAEALESSRVGWAVYYRRPLHRTRAFSGFPRAPGGLPVAERLSEEVLSLPMHPYLDARATTRVAEVVRCALGSVSNRRGR